MTQATVNLVKGISKSAAADVSEHQLHELIYTFKNTPLSVTRSEREVLQPTLILIIQGDATDGSCREAARQALLLLLSMNLLPAVKGAGVVEVDKLRPELDKLARSFLPAADAEARRMLGQAVVAMLIMAEQDRSALDPERHIAPWEQWLEAALKASTTALTASGPRSAGATKSTSLAQKVLTDEQLLSTCRAWQQRMYSPQPPPKNLLQALLALGEELLLQQVAGDEAEGAAAWSSKGSPQAVPESAMIQAVRLMAELLPTQPRLNKQVFDLLGGCFRSVLPAGGRFFGLQVWCLRALLAAGQGQGQRDMLREDLQDFFTLAVSQRWMDYCCMLQLFQLLEEHAGQLLRHYPALLPRWCPLLFKAVAWHPHLLGHPALQLLPVMMTQDSMLAMLNRALDLPVLVVALDTHVSDDVSNSSAYCISANPAPSNSYFGMNRERYRPLTAYFSANSTPPSPATSPFKPGSSSAHLGSAADVITERMEQGFLGAADYEDEMSADQAQLLHSYLHDLAFQDQSHQAQQHYWSNPAVRAGLKRAAATRHPTPRLIYCIRTLGRQLMGSCLGIILRDGSPALQQVLVHHLLLRGCSAYPMQPFQKEGGRLMRGALASVVNRMPWLLLALKKYILPQICAPSDPEAGTDELTADLIWLVGEFVGSPGSNKPQDPTAATLGPPSQLDALALHWTSSATCAEATQARRSPGLPFLQPPLSVLTSGWWRCGAEGLGLRDVSTEFVEMLEVAVYERLQRIADWEAAQPSPTCASPTSTRSGSGSHYTSGGNSSFSPSRPPPLTTLLNRATARPSTPPTATGPAPAPAPAYPPEEPLLLVSLTALTKLVARRKDMRPRVRLLLEKLVSNEDHGSPNASQRAAVCLRVLANSSALQTLSWQSGGLHAHPLPQASALIL